MSDPNTTNFAQRLWEHESLRRGLAGAVAGALIAAISEVAWPSTRS